MEEVKYYSLAAMLYFIIAIFGLFKRDRSKRFGASVLFFLMASLFWSFAATIFITEFALAKKLAQYFYAFFSVTVIFFFMNLTVAAKNGSSQINDADFSSLRKLLLRSFAATAAIVVVWDLLDEFKIPNLSEMVSLGSFLFFAYLLFQVLVPLRSSENRGNLVKILPAISVMLVIKLTEVIRYFEGAKIIEPMSTINYYFLILSPIILSEFIPVVEELHQHANENVSKGNSGSRESASDKNLEQRDSNLEKRSLLEDLNIEKVESKLNELMQNEKIHLDEELRLPSLASEMGLSVHHLSAFLNEHMGMNFNSFINHHRVKEAKVMLLEEPDRSILSIGMAVGFSSSSAFHRAFLKETKKSPKAFREENLTNYKNNEDEMGDLDSRYSHSI
ncbi:AraC family transcriptional regulator [Leptospira stimsonii]|uniref:AraC family transcriptional regulator n=1 Tax=Leptospira stimsonii TaxID=2202203 RepID=A0A4R9L7A5_9LEPT|nr:helix-turn-helix domain-containing protein [Leptospira stimsonii]RHX88252.1 AraC family transcriptional regulator [Leptospira stimsonii]TGK26381.1 AraC family transcriptional regulator [Leptospira stimsonii]TGM20246.1 AraC family transcriptional regulator [Leptospira stimsonii]